MRTNYVLVDYENVQPELLSALAEDHFKVLVFVGASQSKVSYTTAEALQRLGDRAEYVKIAGNGPNALDFHIAFYIGHLSAQDPAAYFHIISKDTGFDPLIQHLKARKVFAARAKDVADIPLVKAAGSKTPDERVDLIVARLQQLGASKPRTTKTLTGTINSLFPKMDGDAGALVELLQARGLITVTGARLSYHLPG